MSASIISLRAVRMLVNKDRPWRYFVLSRQVKTAEVA
jgi:hypothetical protein